MRARVWEGPRHARARFEQLPYLEYSAQNRVYDLGENAETADRLQLCGARGTQRGAGAGAANASTAAVVFVQRQPVFAERQRASRFLKADEDRNWARGQGRICRLRTSAPPEFCARRVHWAASARHVPYLGQAVGRHGGGHPGDELINSAASTNPRSNDPSLPIRISRGSGSVPLLPASDLSTLTLRRLPTKQLPAQQGIGRRLLL